MRSRGSSNLLVLGSPVSHGHMGLALPIHPPGARGGCQRMPCMPAPRTKPWGNAHAMIERSIPES